MEHMTPKLTILSLGWGVQSWTLAAMAALGEIEPVDYAVHADTTWEAEGTYAHREKWEPWLGENGITVVTVKAERPEVIRDDWGENGTMIPAFTLNAAGHHGQIRRQCTHDWKITPIRHFVRKCLAERGLKTSPGTVEMIQGISYDEYQRMRDSDVKYIVNRYPLVDMRMTRAHCILWLDAHGLDVPVKSGCVFCPYNTRARWKALKRNGGLDWETAKTADQTIRQKGEAAGYALYIHSACAPLPDAVKIPEDEGAYQMDLEIAGAPCDSGYCFT